MIYITKLIAVLFLLAAVAGCHVQASHGTWREAEFERSHVHSADCGHYYHHGRWYHHAGHHHGPGCGHVHRDGIWITID